MVAYQPGHDDDRGLIYNGSTVIINDPWNNRVFTKGVYAVFPGYTENNQTTSNLFELLLNSSEDNRFRQWLACFSLLFDVPKDDILEDYIKIRYAAYYVLRTSENCAENYIKSEGKFI